MVLIHTNVIIKAFQERIVGGIKISGQSTRTSFVTSAIRRIALISFLFLVVGEHLFLNCWHHLVV